MILPFEQDDLELLDACAVALLPLSPVPAAQTDRTFTQAEALPSAESRRPWFSGENTVMKQAGSSFGGTFAAVSSEFLPDFPAGVSVEALSRAVERDARRYESY